MMKSTLLALPLLAAVAAADGTPAPQVITPQNTTPEQAAIIAAAQAEVRAQQHNPLNAILAFIHDRDSAEAAAPKVKALAATPEGKDLRMTHEAILFLFYAHNCFESDALREALVPLLPVQLGEVEKFRAVVGPILADISAEMDGIAVIISQVRDEASEAKAVARLRALPAFIRERGDRLEAAAGDMAVAKEEYMYYVMATLQGQCQFAADRLMHTYARVQWNSGSSYTQMAEAIDAAWQAVAPMLGGTPPPDALAENMNRHEHIAFTVREWVKRARQVKDKAGADALADWMVERSKELGIPLGLATFIHPDQSCVCTRVLGTVMRGAKAYLHYASPTYFGSEKLQTQMSLDPRMFQPAE